jgi:hypothetical protein
MTSPTDFIAYRGSSMRRELSKFQRDLHHE